MIKISHPAAVAFNKKFRKRISRSQLEIHQEIDGGDIVIEIDENKFRK